MANCLMLPTFRLSVGNAINAINNEGVAAGTSVSWATAITKNVARVKLP